MGDIELIGVVIAAFAAGFAGWALFQNTAHVRRASTFDHLREVLEAVHRVRPSDPELLRPSILKFYRNEATDLDAASIDYIALLDRLDLLALAREQNAVVRGLVDDYLKTLLGQGTLIDAKFFYDLRQITGDPEVYRHLYTYVREHQIDRFLNEGEGSE